MEESSKENLEVPTSFKKFTLLVMDYRKQIYEKRNYVLITLTFVHMMSLYLQHLYINYKS